jgi:uncharacterized membrane protein
MKIAMLCLGLLISMAATAQAETFTCRFTEPFFTLTYSTETQELARLDVNEKVESVKSNVQFEVVGSSKFVLKSQNGKELARLVLNNNGSDGMSDRIYPLEIKLMDESEIVGGCETSKLKRK